jgi:hypothetical protein
LARPKSKGAYAPLAAQYYLDDAILEVGPDAELMWVRILSFLASVSTDGFITERQVKTVGIGLRSVQNRVNKLTEAGLLTAEHGGFTARSWLKWNKTAEEYVKTLAKDRERKASKRAEVDPNSGRNPNPVRTDSADSTEQYRAVQSRAVHTTALLDSLFAPAWDHWPKKVDRADARKRFALASKTVDPSELASLIRKFGDAYAATTERQYTPALGSWLNRERWTDELPVASGARKLTRTEENLLTVAQYAQQEQKGIA